MCKGWDMATECSDLKILLIEIREREPELTGTPQVMQNLLSYKVERKSPRWLKFRQSYQ